jgi:hypothetical protein
MPARRSPRRSPSLSRLAGAAILLAQTLLLAGPAAAQTALTQTTGAAGQLLLGPGPKSISDSSLGSNTATTLNQDAPAALAAFDAATGVLVGVRGGLQVDSATTLFLSGPPNGNYLGTGRVSTLWTFQPGVTAAAVLANLQITDDTTFAQTDTWSALAYNAPAAALSAFVGSSPLQTNLRTSLLAAKSANSNSAEHRIAASTSDTLTGAVSLQYSYLQHVGAGFDAGGATSLHLDVAAGGADFRLHALGDVQHATRLDLLGVSCVAGACDATILGLGLQDLEAGQSAAFHIAGGARSATYALLVGDNRQVGAAGSQLSQTLTLTVSAVPEPASAALLLAGLAATGLLAWRRTPAGTQRG